MRVIILAAGRGERFLPLTKTLAKPAIPFLNRPIIHYALDKALQGGARAIGVNLHHLPGTVQAALSTWEGAAQVEFFISREETLRGTGGALHAFVNWAGQESLLLLNGDTIIDFDPHHLELAGSCNSALAVLLTRANKDPFKVASVIVDPEDRVRQIAGLPRGGIPPGEPMMFAGAHYLAPGFIRQHSRDAAIDINHEIYPPLISAQKKIIAMKMSSPIWADLGTRESYLGATGGALKAMAAKKWPLKAAPMSRLHTTHTGGLLLQDDKASLNRDTVKVEGFAVAGAGAIVLGEAQLKNSVLLPGAKVGRGARISNSVIGPSAYVQPGQEIVDSIVV